MAKPNYQYEKRKRDLAKKKKKEEKRLRKLARKNPTPIEDQENTPAEDDTEKTETTPES
jgi:hypothetical protein